MIRNGIVVMGCLVGLLTLTDQAEAQASQSSLFKPRVLRAAEKEKPVASPAKEEAKRTAAPAKQAAKPAPARKVASTAPVQAAAPATKPAVEAVALGEPVTLTVADEPAVVAPAAADEPTMVTEPVAPPADTTKTDSTAAPAAAPAVNMIEAGFGRIVFNGLVQAWYMGGTGESQNTFRIRRTELRFTGEIVPQAKWTVMVDPSKALSVNNTYASIDGTKVVTGGTVNQAGRMLQDVMVTLDLGEGIKLDAGQFKLPLSYEGLQSSSKIEIVERALFLTDRARGGAYGDIRDVGARISVPLGKHFDYQVAVYNGMGEAFNSTDGNDEKTVAGRAVLRAPFVKGLQVGGSAAYDPGTEGQQLRRQRIGAEVVYSHGPATLRSEVMGGQDGEIRRLGYYAHADYKFSSRLQGVVRFDTWDPDTKLEAAAADVQEKDYIAGLNYYLAGSNARLQAGLLHKTFGDVAPSRSVLLLNVQTAW